MSTTAEHARRNREELAGDRPIEREGYTLYARLNHNRFGDSYIWIYRQKPALQAREHGEHGKETP